MNDVTPKTFPDIPDTDIEMNDPWNRGISARLYIGDAEQRLRQAKEKHNGQ
jgi:glucan phosphorylase